MEEELQKLYEQYNSSGYNLNKAWRQMAMAGYDTPQARMTMKSFYDGTSKKKSQDASQSESSSEEVSTEPTSATPQPQQPEDGGSDYPLTSYDAIIDDLLPGSLNVPESEFQGPPNRYRSSSVGAYRINPKTLINNEEDQDLDKILLGMQAHTFDQFVRSSAMPVQALSAASKDAMRDLLPEGLIDDLIGPGETAINNYGSIMNRLATAYVLDKRTSEMVREGMGLEEALLKNKEWLKRVVGFTDEDFSRRGSNIYRLGMKGDMFNREMRKVMKEIEEKRDELEAEYLNNHFGRAFVESLPTQYNETFQDAEGKTQFSDAAKSKLASLEKQLKKRTGYGLDLSGDNVVGNRKMLDVGVYPGSNGIFIKGEAIDKLDGAFTNVINGLQYLMAKGTTSMVSAFTPEVYYDKEKGFIDFGEVMMQDFERNYLAKSEQELEVLSREMNEYQRGITASLANGDFSSAIEQSFLMTAEGAPYLAPMLAASRLGITGTAATSAFLGTAVEANMIRNDKTFDTFVKDGKEYSYYEAAREAGTYDMAELEKQFEIKTDYWSRTGYLSSIAAGEFGVNFTLNRALMGAYKKGMNLELQNWFKGYMHGQRTALGESASAMAASTFLRNVAEAQATGGTVDFEEVASQTIDMVLGTAPLTMLLHTGGSAARGIRGTARSSEIIPLNAEELNTLNKQVLEYQKKIANSRDPRFISEANQFINNTRKKIATLRQSSEDYLVYLSENDADAFLEVSNAALTLERLKMNYKNTNDPNLRIQIKQNAEALLTRLDEIYTTNKEGYDKFTGTIRGVREREEKRAEEGRTTEREQQMLNERTQPQQRTDVDIAAEKPAPDPSISSYARRNDRLAKTRMLGQKAKEIFNKWFRSNGGISNQNVEEVVRSRDRLQSAWLDELQFDARLWRQLLKDVRRPNGLVGRKLSKAEMADTQNAMLDALEGRITMDDPRLGTLTKEHKQQLDYFRNHIDSLSEQLIATLESQPAGSPEAMQAKTALIEKIRSNKGVYLNRSYKLFNDGGERLNMLLGDRNKMTAEVRKAYDDAVEYIANQFDNDVTADVPLTKAERLQKADQQLGQYLQGLKNSKDARSFGFLGAADAPFLKARNNELPPAIDALLGRITDPMNAYLRTSSKLNSYLANTRWQTELSMVLKESGIGRVGGEFEGMSSPQGRMVRLFPDTPEWMPLSQQYVPEGFAKMFDNLMPLKKIDSELMQMAVQATAAVKVGKTVFAPTTTSRNFISGMFLGMANGHLPVMTGIKPTLDAMTQAWGASAKRGLKGKGKHSEATWRAERKKLIEMGILNDGANSAELMAFLNDSMGGDIQRIISGGGKQGIAEFAQKLYAFGDDFYKVNGYYQERQAFLDAGMSAADAEAKAAQRVRGGYPTYSYISKGTKALRRFPLAGSFVSFPYEMYRTTMNNFRFMVEDYQAGRTQMAMKRAMGLLTSGTAAYAMSEYSMDKLGFTDEDDEAIRALGPEWQKMSQLIYLGADNGTPYFMDASYMLPHETVVKPIRALFGANPDDEGLMDNVMTSLDEVMKPFYGQDVTFSFVSSLLTNERRDGGKIFHVRPDESPITAALRQPDKVFVHFLNTAAPGFVGNTTEFLRSGAVEEAFELIKGEDLPNGHPLEEAQDDFQDYFPKKTRFKEYTLEDAAYALLGARVTYMPVDVAASSGIRDWEQSVSSEQSEVMRRLMPQPELTMSYEIDELAAKYLTLHNEASRNIQRTTNLAGTLGMNKPETIKLLEQGGVKDDSRGLYLKNKFVFPDLLTEEKVEAYLEGQTWYKGMEREEMKQWLRSGWRNAAEFNRAIAKGYAPELRKYGLSESEIEEILKQKRNELGEADWEDQD